MNFMKQLPSLPSLLTRPSIYNSLLNTSIRHISSTPITSFSSSNISSSTSSSYSHSSSSSLKSSLKSSKRFISMVGSAAMAVGVAVSIDQYIRSLRTRQPLIIDAQESDTTIKNNEVKNHHQNHYQNQNGEKGGSGTAAIRQNNSHSTFPSTSSTSTTTTIPAATSQHEHQHQQHPVHPNVDLQQKDHEHSSTHESTIQLVKKDPNFNFLNPFALIDTSNSLTFDSLHGKGKFEKIEMYHNPTEKKLVSVFHFGDKICGHPTIIHGGAIGVVLDETLGWLFILTSGVGYTANLNINYR